MVSSSRGGKSAAKAPTRTATRQQTQQRPAARTGASSAPRGASSARPAPQQAQQMSDPLDFGFIKGLQRIYFRQWKDCKDGVRRLFIYAEDGVTKEKIKQSFVDPAYTEAWEQIDVPGDYNISYAGKKSDPDGVTLSIEPAGQ